MSDTSAPEAGKTRAVVLGGGVTGLTTAIRLAEAGCEVRVVAKDYLRDTTSWVATAIWHVFWVNVDDRVSRWAAESLDELLQLAEDPATGVSRVRGVEVLRSTASQADLVHGDATFWQQVVPFYEPLTRDDVVARLPDDYDTTTVTGGYVIEVPIADMGTYLPYLMDRQDRLGVVRETATIESLEDLKARYPADVYVNCTGLGSRELVGDTELKGIKGQVVRIAKGSITEYIADDHSPYGMIYILPRTDDVILGGSEDEGREDNDVDLEFGQEILHRCAMLVPEVADNEVFEHLAGVRPFRTSIRLERDEVHDDVIHSYGHGGSGVSLSWACAGDVTDLALGVRVPG